MNFIYLVSRAYAEDHGGGHAAADVAHAHGPAAIPWGNIGVQAFNFAVLILILGFLLRKAVKAHFAHRAQSYRELVDRAEVARREAERNRDDVKVRLASLESSLQENVARAQQEAKNLRERLMSEAKTIADKLEFEGQRTAQIELEKAKAELRRELLHRSLESSRQTMKKGLGSSEQKKLQNEFAEKIEVVGG